MCAERSAPSSCMASSSAVGTLLVCEVCCFFFIACSPDGNYSRPITACCDERRPQYVANSADHLSPRFIGPPGGNLKAIRVFPQSNSIVERYAVFPQIHRRLRRVELEVHRYKKYTKTDARLFSAAADGRSSASSMRF